MHAMAHRRTLKQRWEDKLYDHPLLRSSLKNGWAGLMMIVSAFIFAFGFKCFVAPNYLMVSTSFNGQEFEPVLKLVSGGVSGISQTIIEFVDLVSHHSISGSNAYSLVYSILYFGLNVPVFLIAFFGIGKRFAIMTVINVAFVSIFTNLLSLADGENGVVTQISYWANENGGLLSRAIFGGVATGLSSALAYKMDASAGGIDVIAYRVSLKTNKLAGKYGLFLNSVTIVTFTILSVIDYGIGESEAAHVLVASLFAVLYLMVVSLLIDAINLRNKKMKIQVVTSLPDLASIIIANIPHGATVIPGHGAYSKQEKYIIQIVVSSYEVKETVRVIREADPKAFVEVSELKHVYGRFHLPAIK